MQRLYHLSSILAIGCGVTHFLLSRHLVATRPRIPDLVSGATNYYKGASGIVFLTDVELMLVQTLWVVAFSSAAIALALVLYRRFKGRS
jgi:hypothetical protein